MQQEFSNYPKCLRLLRYLDALGYSEATWNLEEYEDIKKEKGEFLAALHLVNVYGEVEPLVKAFKLVV